MCLDLSTTAESIAVIWKEMVETKTKQMRDFWILNFECLICGFKLGFVRTLEFVIAVKWPFKAAAEENIMKLADEWLSKKVTMLELQVTLLCLVSSSSDIFSRCVAAWSCCFRALLGNRWALSSESMCYLVLPLRSSCYTFAGILLLCYFKLIMN